MRRSNSTRRIVPLQWLLALVLSAGLLVFLFSLVQPVRELAQGRFGIRADELAWYAGWCDLSGKEDTLVKPETYAFGSQDSACFTAGHGAGWSKQWFRTDDHADTVRMRRLRTVEGGWVIKFRREMPFRAQRHIVLIPAGVSSIRYKYLEVLANELGLITPEVSFVRVVTCGEDVGIYLKEERIDDDFLEKQGLAGASLFEQGHHPERPDHLYPAFEDDTLAGPMLRRSLDLAYADITMGRQGALPYVVDLRAGVALLLMRWMEQGASAYSGEQVHAYSWSRGRIIPLYRHARAGEEVGMVPGRPSLDFFTGLLHDPAIREAFRARREELLEQRWKLKERFAAIDRAWLPILVGEGSIARARNEALRIQDELIGARLDDPRALELLQRKLVRHAGASAFLSDQAGERYWPSADDAGIIARIIDRTKAFMRGDTLVFPRGRYAIREDLITPYGKKVVIEDGARFEIAAGKSMVVQGPLDVRGTSRNPVFVRPMEDGSPFGTFAVLGDGTTKCSISGLQLSGGSEARINGVYFSGQMAIHNVAGTRLSDCVISGSEGEDLLNIKGGAVLLSDCVFEDGLADLVDLDRCAGSISDCLFRSGRKDSNGDGLDVSGARVRVSGCTFERMMDKGISVGEASQLLVRGSRFEGNRVALVAKDLSIAYAEGNVFVENQVVFGAYRIRRC
jgi:Right handed beta helix region